MGGRAAGPASCARTEEGTARASAQTPRLNFLRVGESMRPLCQLPARDPSNSGGEFGPGWGPGDRHPEKTARTAQRTPVQIVYLSPPGRSLTPAAPMNTVCPFLTPALR